MIYLDVISIVEEPFHKSRLLVDLALQDVINTIVKTRDTAEDRGTKSLEIANNVLQIALLIRGEKH